MMVVIGSVIRQIQQPALQNPTCRQSYVWEDPFMVDLLLGIAFFVDKVSYLLFKE